VAQGVAAAHDAFMSTLRSSRSVTVDGEAQGLGDVVPAGRTEVETSHGAYRTLPRDRIHRLRLDDDAVTFDPAAHPEPLEADRAWSGAD
jgi:hypothetical protein